MESQLPSGLLAGAGLPGRYAAALFDLAQADKSLEPTAGALRQLGDAVAESAELRALIAAPQLGRDAAGRAIAAVADALDLPPLVHNFLGVLAANGRLKLLPAIVRTFGEMVRRHQGAAIAAVTVAQPLTEAQQQVLAAKLKARTGRQMDLSITVDPAILGGLIVRIGSEQIDASVKTRLARLGQQMKGL